MPNVIRQIARDDEFGTQSIRIIMTSNDRGPQGEPGEPGEAATIEAGQAYSVEPGQSPAVMNTGTPNAAVFDFYIPKGEKGERGEPGPAGADKWGEITGNIADQTDLQNALNGKQNKLTAGSNITISGNTISATDTTYTAGNGLNLNHGEFSVNTGTIQEKLTAGANVDITGDTISATDTTYTAGAGLDLNGTEFSVDTDTIQSKLTAGSNVQINGNTISATDTTYTAGNAITIDSGNNNAINAAIEPADFFTSTESKITGTGTSVTLTPTTGLPLSSVQLKGDTTQQTYSGKNLLGNLVSTGTNNGLTTVVNADGSLSVSGTATTTYATLTAAVNINVSNGTSMTFSIKSNPSVTVGVILYNTGYANRQDMNIDTSARYVTVNTNSAKTLAVVWCSGLTANTYYDFKVEELQLEKASSATTYEPYVGGIPAPNPNYPQPVNTVTGRQVVEVYGKNLLNLTAFVKGRVDSGVVGYESGTSSISVSGNNISFTTTSDNRGIVSEMIEVTPSTEYTFSGTSTTVDYRYVDYYDNTGTWLSRATGGSSFANLTFTTPSNCYGIRLSFRLATAGTGTVSNAQLEKGSSATPYQSHQSYEVNLGKNLYNLNNTLENRYLDSSGGWQTDNNKTYNNFEISVEPGSSIAISFASRVSAAIRAGEFTGNGTFITRTIIAGGGSATSPQIFTLQNNTKKVIFSIDQSGTNYYTDLQIELGSTATTYAPYFTPIELCKIGDYQDYIYKSGDDWYVHKACGEVEFDGTEGWYLPNSSSYPNLFQATLTGITINSGYTTGSTDLPAYCGYFTRRNSDTVRNNVGYAIYNEGGNATVRLNNNNYTTTTAFDNWLLSNDVSIYYALATPTDTQITNADLIAQLEALLAANSYDPTTIFTASSEYLQAVLSVSTLRKSLAGVLEAIRRQ